MGQTCAAVLLKEEALSRSQVTPGVPYPHVGRTRQRQTGEGQKIDQTFGTYWALTLGVSHGPRSQQCLRAPLASASMRRALYNASSRLGS